VNRACEWLSAYGGPLCRDERSDPTDDPGSGVQDMR